jgi:hypothetical protein
MASDNVVVQLTADTSLSASKSRNRRRSIARGGDSVHAEAARAAAEAKLEDAAIAGLARHPGHQGRRRSIVQEHMDKLYDDMRAKDAKVELLPFVR